MKISFRYQWNHHEPVYGHMPYLWAKIKLLEVSEETNEEFQKYLLSALESDFPAHHSDFCDEVLCNIAKLEQGKLETSEWEGEGFWHYLIPSKVTFEHAIFGECPEWPIWSCTLAQYKAALQGWRKFINMPKSIESEMIIELPDDIQS